MLRHSQKLNLNGYFFSISYMPMYVLLKKKNMQSKAKRSKMFLNMIVSMYSRRCGSYRMYLESDSPHQAVMIVCELKRFSHISNRHNMCLHSMCLALRESWASMWFLFLYYLLWIQMATLVLNILLFCRPELIN